MKYFSHLNTAVTILQQYQGQQPFDVFIKQFFSLDKKYGSKDRKNISQLCYAYFRLGKALTGLNIDERILAGLFLCSDQPNELIENLRPEWNDSITENINSKIELLTTHHSVLTIFPWQEELSREINYKSFTTSFLYQPNLFIRLRPRKEALVKKKLDAAGLGYQELNNNCLSLSNASKLNEVISLNKEAVVQDFNSQRVGEFLQLISQNPKLSHQKSTLWDCCAGSGGKSIMAYDIIPNIDLTVSDVRPSILSNLKKRLTEAGIQDYHSFIADLTANDLSFEKFDVIIADVPCTGSGTWSRTPEQLFFFDPSSIENYSNLQKRIVRRVIPSLVPGGHFLYITCSVFKKENEEIVEFISSQCGLTLKKIELLKGYDLRADTLFAALFTL